MGVLDVPPLSRAAADARYDRVPRGFRTIVLGDSIDAAPQGWFPYYSLGCKRMEVVRNAGIGGQTTDQMLARIQTDVLAYNPDVVICGGNTNDHGGGVTAAQTRSNIQAMVAGIRSIGATPILRTTPPCDAAGQGAFNTIALRRQGILAHNSWLYGYAARNGLDILDIHQAVVDPTTGGYQSGVTSDSVHPTETGYKAMADYLLGLPLPVALRGSFPFARAVTDDTNVLTNGVFVGDSNSDGVADGGWYTGGTGLTSALSAAASGITGNWQRITASGSSSIYLAQDVGVGTKFAIGDVVQLVGRVRASAGGAALVRFATVGGSGNIDPVASLTRGVDGVFSGRVTVPTNTTALRVLVQYSGAAGYIEVAEVAIRNLTTLGLA